AGGAGRCRVPFPARAVVAHRLRLRARLPPAQAAARTPVAVAVGAVCRQDRSVHPGGGADGAARGRGGDRETVPGVRERQGVSAEPLEVKLFKEVIKMEFLNLILEPLQEVFAKFKAFAPSLLAMLVILVVGIVLARVLRAALVKFLTAVKFDSWSDRMGFTTLMRKGDLWMK